MAAGMLQILYKEPLRSYAMPALTLRYFVLTIDANGHTNWPTNSSTKARKLLRKFAKLKTQALLDNAAYPLDKSMSGALSNTSDRMLVLRGDPRDIPNM
eukprot:6081413-Pleurochrysis_carterae.AAC.1